MSKPELSPGLRLKQAWAQGAVQVPGVFNPLVGRLAEKLGYQAVYVSGAALTASLGLPDIGLVGMTEFADAIRALAQTCSLPILCDADTGFGEALHVERAVRLYEQAGAAGLHLEDQVLPKRCGHLSGKQLVSAEVHASKIRAAVAARHDPDFLVIARTDARGVTGFADAVARARAYLAAGADVIFPEALETVEEFAQFAREVPAPLLANMTEFGKSPTLDLATLSKLGYKLVLYPVSALRIALQAVEKFLKDLQAEGQQRASLPNMLTRADLYDLLGYAGYEARDREYFQ